MLGVAEAMGVGLRFAVVAEAIAVAVELTLAAAVAVLVDVAVGLGVAVLVRVAEAVGVVVTVALAVGVGVGVVAGVGVAVPVAVGVGDGPPLPAKPTRLDIAAGTAAVASKITAVQATSAEVLTIRASPWATAVVVTTAFSKKARVPVVPKVTVAPGATFRTAPLPAATLLRTVPSGPSNSTPRSIG